MNFTQLQERVRLELRRRIERGAQSVSLLSRQTGLGKPHLSNFLNGRRGLSLEALDKVLAGLRMTVADLLPTTRGELPELQQGEQASVPLVAHAVALEEPYMRLSNVLRMVPLPAEMLHKLESRCTATRRQWERFVAIQLTAEDALLMDPVLRAGALVVLDRHYNSLRAYRHGQPNLYAVRNGRGHLVLRYVEFQAGRLVLRARSVVHAIELIEISHGEAPQDYVAGRVALVMNEA